MWKKGGPSLGTRDGGEQFRYWLILAKFSLSLCPSVIVIHVVCYNIIATALLLLLLNKEIVYAK